MTLDARARATAARLMAKYAKSVTYTSMVAGAYNPATGTVTQTETAYPIKALIEDFGFRNAGAGFVLGLIREGDKQITIAALGLAFVPQTGDKVTSDGVTYTATNIKATYSGELVALYIVHGRQ